MLKKELGFPDTQLRVKYQNLEPREFLFYGSGGLAASGLIVGGRICGFGSVGMENWGR